MTRQLCLDKFGRVLIPKKLRDELGLRVGEAMTLELDGHSLRLQPASRAAQVVEHHGRLILDVPGQAITGDALEEMRQARDAEVLGDWLKL